MLIPFIAKDPERNDFTCRDGEIEFALLMEGGHPDRQPEGLPVSRTSVRQQATPDGVAVRMTALHEMPTANIRIPLQSGDRTKAELMLSGQISRVDPATAERLTQAIVLKAAETLLQLSTDLRRQGLFILPFRFYTMVQLSDGTLSYPTPQGVALPTDFPPHPEITTASVTDDALTLSLRFPVRPHRLVIQSSKDLHTDGLRRTFISYPLYIPDPKEIRGSIGSVRSADGGNATGIRFAFLSASALKASVTAPEKYYEFVGNERTGYRISSKAAPAPDYSCYADLYGYVPPFPGGSLLALGEGLDAETDTGIDPGDWIADWVKADCNVADGETQNTDAEGYLPASLPHKYWHSDSSDLSDASNLERLLTGIEGIDADFIRATSDEYGLPYVLLTRPMTFARDSASRRNASPTAIRTLRVLGIPPDVAAHAILYGSDDCVRWEPLRHFDPRADSLLLTPPRLFWRVLLMEGGHPDRPPLNCHEGGAETVFLETCVLNVGLRPLLLQ